MDRNTDKHTDTDTDSDTETATDMVRPTETYTCIERDECRD